VCVCVCASVFPATVSMVTLTTQVAVKFVEQFPVFMLSYATLTEELHLLSPDMNDQFSSLLELL